MTGFLIKDIETYGVLKISAQGRDFMKNPKPFMLIEERDYLVIDDGWAPEWLVVSINK